ncbi:uncharacterized protein LOC124631876 [Helicoverpa zea]|uniref:uncharacterized protein LOC124631876 n=1 Tax=Helicoverpa zea TaxID=7113 RepID=UPI001F55E600|nr:uncharacterized protein LOC124631876 [Helicoverpa zea]
MAEDRVIVPDDRNFMYKANSGGIRFKMRTTGHFPELALIAAHDPNLCLYKITLGQETRVYNFGDKQEEKFPIGDIPNFHYFREYYISWHSNKIKIGEVGHKPFVNYDRLYTEPIIGFVLFRPDCKHSIPVEWIVELSPVELSIVPTKKFSDRLQWLPMVDGKLPQNAMIGGFENEPTYIARAEHNNSLCPGKYVPSIGKAFVAWGGREFDKQNFEILCGYNAKWIKTRTNYIPQNAFIGGRSEVQNEPLYIGRAKIDRKLIPGKVHVRYKTCYLPYDGKEVEVSLYEILVLPDDEIPQGVALPS